jgi:hypothetical protein
LGLALLVVAGVTGFQLQQNRQEEQRYQAELVDATPVKLGALTEKQRAHSNLFADYRQPTFNVRELIAKANGKSKIAGISFAPGMQPLLTTPERPEDYFGRISKESDAVILGRVITRESYVTEDETFVFTDYEIAIIEVLKNNAIAPISMGQSITVTRPEGKVLINGVIIKCENAAYTPLPKNDKEVVLFLRFIKETGAYKATGANASFELNGSILLPLTKSSFPPGVLQDANAFLQTARTVSKDN